MSFFLIYDKNEFLLGYIDTTASEELIEEMKEEGIFEVNRNYGVNELVDDLNSAGFETERI